MNYKIINSGSDGNATVIEEFILIDCGVSFKKLKNYYINLKVVLLTHIHQDHFNKKTIKRLSFERPNLKFICCEWLVDELLKCGVDKRNIYVIEIDKRYDLGAFQLEAINAYHDVPNCGYKIFIDDKKVFYITDTNSLDEIVAKNFDLYLIEANYEVEDLKKRIREKEEKGEYIYETRVEYTHLSKEQCDSFLIENGNNNSIFEYMHVHKERRDYYDE